MGWWETADGLTLGDGPLDELHRSLRDVAESYRNAVGRPPTVAELEHLLALVVDSLGEQEMDGLDGLSVSAVVMKTKKGKRRVAAAVGDVFAIPLPDGTFGFGRILHDDTRGELTVEFFSRRGRMPFTDPDVVHEPRLRPPARVAAFYSVASGRWPVLFHHEGFRAPDHDEIRFAFSVGAGSAFHLFDLEGRALFRNGTPDQVPAGTPETTEYETGSAVDHPDLAEADVARLLDDAGL